MNASDIVGYTFAGGQYCLDHLPANPPGCTCAPSELDSSRTVPGELSRIRAGARRRGRRRTHGHV